MFDIGYSELLIIAVVALIVIGPKDLPRVMRTVGQWVGRARGMARHFRSGIDTMMRESELQEMEKKWREDNERIMREHSGAVGAWDSAAGMPAPDSVQPLPSEAGGPVDEIGERDPWVSAASPEPPSLEKPSAPPARAPGEPLP
ncbi:MAG TPA: Sec-independent protein translocase protein TatB [Allosphingosinicella sp.]|jgi:sec-independent protein translocase protein TatB